MGSNFSKSQKEELRKLRKEGLSYTEIQEEVDFEVAYSTISYNVSDIELSKSQKKTLRR